MDRVAVIATRRITNLVSPSVARRDFLRKALVFSNYGNGCFLPEWNLLRTYYAAFASRIPAPAELLSFSVFCHILRECYCEAKDPLPYVSVDGGSAPNVDIFPGEDLVLRPVNWFTTVGSADDGFPLEAKRGNGILVDLRGARESAVELAALEVWEVVALRDRPARSEDQLQVLGVGTVEFITQRGRA